MTFSPWLSRRLLLQGLLGLVACGDSSSESPVGGAGGAGAGGGAGAAGSAGSAAGSGGAGGAPGSSEVPYSVWREAQAALRGSPDHLRHESERVVASKDAAAIFAFVQRSFATRPLLGSQDFTDPRTQTGWGRRGLLRSGSGTPRDKVELLRALLTEAGFTASVVDGPVDGATYWARVFGATPTRAFAPAITPERVSELRALLQLGAPSTAAPIDLDAPSTGALADALLALLPGSRAASLSPPGLTSPRAPYVKAVIGGQTRVLDPNDPAATFGVDPAGPLLSTSDAESFDPAISVSVLMVTSAEPDPIELVKASFKLADVVGRSVLVNMMPPSGIESVLLSSLRDVRAFVPAVSLTGVDLTTAEREASLRTGAAFTIGGAVVEIAGDKATVNGIELDTTPLDPTTLASVASLDLAVFPGSYPSIRMRVSALDSSGNSVPGLPASAFAVSEGGQRLGAALTENRSRPPRVVFVLDRSSSIPADFQGEPAAALLRDIATTVKGEFPDATFNVFSITNSPDKNAWTGDPQALHDAALATKSSSSSDLWDAMAQAAELDPSFVVMVTDGDGTDEPSQKTATSAASIPGSVHLLVGSGDATKLGAVAAASNGSVVPVADVGAAKEVVLTALRKAVRSIYALEYRADEGGPPTRTVQVALVTNAAVAATASYTVPAPGQVTPAPRLAGLLLRVGVGSNEVTRVLGGVRRVRPETPESAYEEAALACFGSVEIRFEGEAPTASAALDELVSARLSSEPFYLAARSGDGARALDAFLAGWDRPDATLLALASVATPTPGGALVSEGPRAIVTTLRPSLGSSVVVRADVLPLLRLRSLAPDLKAAFDETLRGSLRIAVAEAALYSTSTISSLGDRPLVYLPPFSGISSVVPGLPLETQRAWDDLLETYGSYHCLVPSSGELLGFYAIHRDTGTVTAVLPDGTGGGATRSNIERELSWAISTLNWASAVGGFFGVIGLAGGAWLAFEKAKAKKIIQATIAIDTLDAPPGADGLEDMMKDIACDLLKGVAGDVLGRWALLDRPPLQAVGVLGTQILMADGFVEAAVGRSRIECF